MGSIGAGASGVGVSGGKVTSATISSLSNLTRDGRAASTIVVFPNSSNNANFRDARTKYRGFAISMGRASDATRQAFLNTLSGRANTFARNAEASVRKAERQAIAQGRSEREVAITREMTRTAVQRRAIQNLIDNDDRFKSIKLRDISRRDYRNFG